MSVIDRFTRDTASKYVWGLLALAAAGALAFSILNGDSAVEDERTNAQARAVQYVEEALSPRVEGLDLSRAHHRSRRRVTGCSRRPNDPGGSAPFPSSHLVG